MDKHPTHYKGDLAEAAIIYDLAKRNIPVFTPLNQGLFADLVIFRNNKFESMQVKYLTPNKNGILKLQVQRRGYAVAGTYSTYHYRDTPLLWIAIFNSDNEKICYIHRDIWSTCNYEMLIHTNNKKDVRVKYHFNDFPNTIVRSILWESKMDP